MTKIYTAHKGKKILYCTEKYWDLRTYWTPLVYASIYQILQNGILPTWCPVIVGAQLRVWGEPYPFIAIIRFDQTYPYGTYELCQSKQNTIKDTWL